jgi:SNF2 family DNA or RNA helicase
VALAELGDEELKSGHLFRRQTYKFKVRPYKHQHDAIKRSLTQLKKTGGVALLMEPRTGKTKVAIDTACILHQKGEVSRVMVFCPNGVIGVWEDEIAANCPFPYRILIWDRRGRKKFQLPSTRPGVIDFVILNYDAGSTPGKLLTKQVKDAQGEMRTVKYRSKRGGKYDFRKAIKAWKPDMIIADESHKFKKPSATKTRTMHILRPYTRYAMILTGTILTKKKRIVDVYSQVKFMNPNSKLVRGHNAKSFKEMYSRNLSKGVYEQWIGNRNEAKLRRLLHAEAYSVTRAECYDLPPSRIQIVHFQLTGHNAELYQQMAEDMIAKIKTGEITEAQIQLVQSLRLAQLTSGFAKTTPTEEHPEARLIRVGRDKFRTWADRVEDLAEAEEKIVVAARFKADIATIIQHCKSIKVPCYAVYGGVERRERDRRRKMFNERPGPSVFVMQPQASSVGIDLRSSSIFHWYSLTNSWVDFTQAMDRVALAERGVVYEFFEAVGTIDTVMREGLAEDEEIGKRVMRNPDKLWVPELQDQ